MIVFRHYALLASLAALSLVLETAGQTPPAPAGSKSLAVIGPILTMDPGNPRATGMVVVGGRILELCDAAHAEQVAERHGLPIYRVPAGGVAMPGIIESHAHFQSLGRARRTLDLRGTTSAAEVARKVEEAVKGTPEGHWILGRGWDQELWPDRKFPDAGLLDQAAPRHAVHLVRVDGHAAWVNTRALDLAGLSAATAPPAGGEILKDANGRPTGVLVDNAMDLMGKALPTDQDRDATIGDFLAAQEEALRNGITTFVDAGTSAESLFTLNSLYADGRMRLRTYSMLGVDDERGLDRILEREPIRGIHDDRAAVRALKLYADGALGSRGALLLESYADRPDHAGLKVLDPAFIEIAAKRALRRGYQLCVHAIGDLAVRSTLDAFERAFAGATEGERFDPRFRIEHAQIVHPDDVRRFRKLSVLPSMQACHAISDGPWVKDRLGAERTHVRAYPWRLLLDLGAIIPNGTDAPVEPISPWRNLYAACTRFLGNSDRDPLPFTPHQRMNRGEALESLTAWGAFGIFAEQERGRLRPGFQADFIILDRDVSTCSIWDLEATQVQLTAIAGEVVFEGAR